MSDTTVVVENVTTTVVVTSESPRVIVQSPQTRVIKVAAPGPQGPQGAPGVDGEPTDAQVEEAIDNYFVENPLPSPAYVHDQSAAATLWTIHHNLGFHPSGITVIDTAGTVWEPGGVSYPDLNTLALSFNAAFAGTAYLS